MFVILDRDGVINEDSAAFVRTPAQWRPIPGSLQAVARLNALGWRVAVATNQSGVARGHLTESMLLAIHQHMDTELAGVGGRIDALAYCPHLPKAGCACRKPNTGLILQLEAQLARSAVGCPFIGDSLSDIQAAQRHGCLPILVRTGKGAQNETAARALGVTKVFADLAEAVDWLVTHY